MKFFLMLVVMTASSWFLFSCAEPPQSGQLEWRNGWVRALPPGTGMTAAYGELWNGSPEALELLTFDSSAFKSASLHLTVVEDGVSRMEAQKAIRLAPGQMLKLEPGGLHLMLMGANAKFAVGDEIQIAVNGENNRFEFSLPVKSQ